MALLASRRMLWMWKNPKALHAWLCAFYSPFCSRCRKLGWNKYLLNRDIFLNIMILDPQGTYQADESWFSEEKTAVKKSEKHRLHKQRRWNQPSTCWCPVLRLFYCMTHGPSYWLIDCYFLVACLLPTLKYSQDSLGEGTNLITSGLLGKERFSLQVWLSQHAQDS